MLYHPKLTAAHTHNSGPVSGRPPRSTAAPCAAPEAGSSRVKPKVVEYSSSTLRCAVAPRAIGVNPSNSTPSRFLCGYCTRGRLLDPQILWALVTSLQAPGSGPERYVPSEIVLRTLQITVPPTSYGTTVLVKVMRELACLHGRRVFKARWWLALSKMAGLLCGIMNNFTGSDQALVVLAAPFSKGNFKG